MKALLVAFSYLYYVTASYASENIMLAETHQLKSIILGEQRSYSVYLPPSYNQTSNKYIQLFTCLMATQPI